MSRLDQKRERKLQPERIKYAVEQIESLGFEILFLNETEVQFLYKNERVNFFAYSGWHTGKSIKDGRGIKNLLNQIKTK